MASRMPYPHTGRCPDWDTYLEAVGMPGMGGGLLELQALGDMMSVSCTLHTLDGEEPVVLPQRGDSQMHLLQHDGRIDLMVAFRDVPAHSARADVEMGGLALPRIVPPVHDATTQTMEESTWYRIPPGLTPRDLGGGRGLLFPGMGKRDTPPGAGWPLRRGLAPTVCRLTLDPSPLLPLVGRFPSQRHGGTLLVGGLPQGAAGGSCMGQPSGDQGPLGCYSAVGGGVPSRWSSPYRLSSRG